MLKKNLDRLNSLFVYRADNGNGWRFMKLEKGKLYGDCEDYSLTLAKMDSGGLLRFFWHYLKGDISLHYCRNKSSGNGHCVLSCGSLFIDNQTKEWGSKERIERYYFIEKRFSFLTVMAALFQGFVKRLFK